MLTISAAAMLDPPSWTLNFLLQNCKEHHQKPPEHKFHRYLMTFAYWTISTLAILDPPSSIFNFLLQNWKKHHQKPSYTKFHQNRANSFWEISEERIYVLLVRKGLMTTSEYCVQEENPGMSTIYFVLYVFTLFLRKSQTKGSKENNFYIFLFIYTSLFMFYIFTFINLLSLL